MTSHGSQNKIQSPYHLYKALHKLALVCMFDFFLLLILFQLYWPSNASSPPLFEFFHQLILFAYNVLNYIYKAGSSLFSSVNSNVIFLRETFFPFNTNNSLSRPQVIIYYRKLFHLPPSIVSQIEVFMYFLKICFLSSPAKG